MSEDATLKILKLVQEGILTPEQGQRLIKELDGNPAGPESTDNGKTPPPFGDVFSFLGQGVEKVLRDFQTGVQFATQTVRDNLGLGPQNLLIKTVEIDSGKEKLSLTFPLKIFLAFKVILTQDNPLLPPPLRKIDFKLIFQSLESGDAGKIFEVLDHEKGDRIEVWVV